MISVEQAKQLYAPQEVPTDKELEQILAAFYGIATREWDEIVEEMSHEQD